MKIFKATLLGLLLINSTAVAFDLTGSGNDLTADGGVDSRFVTIKQGGQAFTITSLPQNCTGDLHFGNLTQVGTVAENGQLASVFGNGEIGFSLTAVIDGQQHALTTNQTIPCQHGQSAILTAKFYRQTNFATTTLQNVIRQTFTVNGNNHTLNANVTFAKQPSNYSCQLISANQQTIHLAPILASDLEQKNRIQNSNSVTFSLNCNSAQATVMAMAYDNLNQNNVGTTILSTKTGAEYATGVGVELYKDGKVLPLGQKTTTAPLFFDDTYWQINGGDNRTLTLQAGYVKTGTISSGKVQAQAGLVFVYP